MDCANNQAVVTWDASQGALMYKVTALGNNVTASCGTNGLTCTLKDLVCGQEYSVQVVAMDNICSSLPSPATLFNSGTLSGKKGSMEVGKYSYSSLIVVDTQPEAVNPLSGPLYKPKVSSLSRRS